MLKAAAAILDEPLLVLTASIAEASAERQEDRLWGIGMLLR